MNTRNPVLILLVPVLLVMLCVGGAMGNTQTSQIITDIPATAWESLSKKKIIFGHQSVGANIIKGMHALMQENRQIKLTFNDFSQNGAIKSGAFNHFRVGNNMDPESKITSFAHTLEQGGGRTDIAFFKFCYIDVTAKTDPEALFEVYRKSMDRLAVLHPRTVFVHVTLPLTKRQTGLKAMIKKIVGKPVSGREENVVRSRYNTLLLKEYNGKAPVFDLARIEATHPDGRQEYFEISGSKYLSLVPGYTYDDGHLNESGSRVAAEELVRFLALLGSKHGQ